MEGSADVNWISLAGEYKEIYDMLNPKYLIANIPMLNSN